MVFQILGLPAATSIFLAGFTGSAFVVLLAQSSMDEGNDIKLKDGLTLSGIVAAGSLLYIDYLNYIGDIPVDISSNLVGWINSGIIEVAGLTKFFAFLVLAWKFIDYDFPGKMEFFNKVTG